MRLYYIMTSVKYGTKPHAITVESDQENFAAFVEGFNSGAPIKALTRAVFSHDEETGEVLMKREPVAVNAEHIVSISLAHPPRPRVIRVPAPEPNEAPAGSAPVPDSVPLNHLV